MQNSLGEVADKVKDVAGTVKNVAKVIPGGQVIAAKAALVEKGAEGVSALAGSKNQAGEEPGSFFTKLEGGEDEPIGLPVLGSVSSIAFNLVEQFANKPKEPEKDRSFDLSF